MHLSYTGYLFECKSHNTSSQVGIRESYNFVVRDGFIHVTLLCSMNMHGNLVKPAYYNNITGFKSIDTVFAQTVGKKCWYGVLSSMQLLCRIKLLFDEHTGILNVEKSKFDLYLPKSLVEDMSKVIRTSGKSCPALVCDLIVPREIKSTESCNCIALPKALYNGMLNSLKQIQLSDVETKEAYLAYRLGVGGHL